MLWSVTLIKIGEKHISASHVISDNISGSTGSLRPLTHSQLMQTWFIHRLGMRGAYGHFQGSSPQFLSLEGNCSCHKSYTFSYLNSSPQRTFPVSAIGTGVFMPQLRHVHTCQNRCYSIKKREEKLSRKKQQWHAHLDTAETATRRFHDKHKWSVSY